MTDYGHRLDFGVFLTPEASTAQQVVRSAQLADELGYDLVTFQDHPYQARYLDTWTLLSYVAASTTAIRVAPNVANLPLRPPAVLAKSAASLDILSGGRAELALGAGGFWDAIAAYGGRKLPPGQAVDALEEAIAVIRAIWTDGSSGVRFRGQHYQLSGAHAGPAPAHEIPIWVGALKPRMLALIGRLADGWLPSSAYLAPDKLAEANKQIDDAAYEAGRDPAAIRRLYNVSGSFDRDDGQFLHGQPKVWSEQLAELALTEGMATFILATDDLDDIRRFAAEVLPAVRETVAAERALRGPTSGARSHRAGAADRAPAPSGRASSAGPFRPVATPPPAQRLSTESESVWDEVTRPSAPPADPARLYTPHEQAAGQHLIDVHDVLRAELTELSGVVAQVVGGRLDPGAARSQLNDMTLRQNNWAVGAYCQSYCRTVTMHHYAEDQAVFPHLRQKDAALAPVVNRLEAEHVVIHELIDRVDRALVAFVVDQDDEELVGALAVLNDALLSHLSYEERELIEPLARLGFQ